MCFGLVIVERVWLKYWLICKYAPENCECVCSPRCGISVLSVYTYRIIKVRANDGCEIAELETLSQNCAHANTGELHYIDGNRRCGNLNVLLRNGFESCTGKVTLLIWSIVAALLLCVCVVVATAFRMWLSTHGQSFHPDTCAWVWVSVMTLWIFCWQPPTVDRRQRWWWWDDNRLCPGFAIGNIIE